MNHLENPIAQNRTEELGYDLWDDFVIPPYYDKLDLLSAKKPRVIVGGRGCGKTMLLRYLSHQSQFSKKRNFVDSYLVDHIGLYWKIDTQFVKILTKRRLEDYEWQSAFEHLATLTICQEVLKSIESVVKSKYTSSQAIQINSLDLSILNSFNKDIPSDYESLRIYLRREYNIFQTWASNINRNSIPLFLPKLFAIELINEIKNQFSIFSQTTFFVYIDEYENLLEPQQNLINTWLKHSEMPLIFNVAMKRESFTNKRTVGNEQLVSIHDYKEYDLESFYDEESDFNLFAAEILFLRLVKYGVTGLPIDPEVLRTPTYVALKIRKSKEYKLNVIATAKKYLPSLSQEEMAIEVLTDDRLCRRLNIMISDALKQKRSQLKPNQFISKNFPEASIVTIALLNRKHKAEDVLNELKKLEAGKENKFTGDTGWIHNNFVGCLLLIYEPLPRPCNFYSGFDAFCKMSRSNLRHFLELCHKAIGISDTSESDNSNIAVSITPSKQAEAAKQASANLLKEIKSFGTNGAALYTFVLRLGIYFSIAQSRPSQSEPEQNHFSIRENSIDPKIRVFLSECLKWSVLYESRITKQKGGTEIEDVEYILNPVYAPYFHISYRKKRRVTFSENDLQIIIFGDISSFKNMLSKQSKNLRVTLQESTLPLFQSFNIIDNED